jgi:hypothetical protein
MSTIGRRDLLLFCPSVLIPTVVRATPRFAFEERHIAKESQKPSYDIDLRYPHLRYPRIPAFNAAVREIVRRRLAHYRAKQLPPKDSIHGGGLALRSTVTTRRDGVVSVLFDWDCAIAGNFHSNQELASLVFDTRSAQPVELSAMFRTGVNYVTVLSRLAIADLVRQKERLHMNIQGEGRKWIEKGAGPIARNFRVFTLTDQALVLHFATYQVGSYVEHEYQAQIPWKTLGSQLATRWRNGL